MRIAFGSNHRGCPIRDLVFGLLEQLGHEVVDFSPRDKGPSDYPDVAAPVARQVSRGDADRGVLLSGTGIGMCIAANKFPGVRAAPCHDEWTAELCRRHNDVNVLCLSAAMLGEEPIRRIVETWLNTPFDGGRHARRVQKISRLEQLTPPSR